MNTINIKSSKYFPFPIRPNEVMFPPTRSFRSLLCWKILVVIGFLCHPVSGAEFGDFYYTDNGTTITIDNYIGLGGAVSLPASIVGKPVTAIADGAFQTRPEITSVTIPNSVTSIGIRAFQECPNLTSVSIPSGVTNIGSRAFYLCSSLPSITIPSGLTVLQEGLFSDCYALSNVTIPSNVTTIGDNAFKDCSSITSLTIPSSVTTIGRGAFEECSGLASVTIPTSVTSIGSYAFNDCTALTNVVLPGSVTSIADYAFSACKGLTSVTIPASVTSIGSRAFEYCWKLPTVTIPAGVTSIGFEAFYNCSLLATATFLGNAPSTMGTNVFSNAAPSFKIIYPSSASGFTTPTWQGYPAGPAKSPTVPEIVVEQPVKSNLIDGKSKKSFGTVKVGKIGSAKTFTVRNTGTASLTGIKVSLVGKHAKDFILTKSVKTSLPPAAATTFKVTFKPKAKGTRIAALRINSNDKDENPFDVPLTGTGSR
jgi:hypothetical protein